jgi:hypothetical protein
LRIAMAFACAESRRLRIRFNRGLTSNTLCKGQHDSKRRALALASTLCRHDAAVEFGEMAHDCEAKAEAAMFSDVASRNPTQWGIRRMRSIPPGSTR